MTIYVWQRKALLMLLCILLAAPALAQSWTIGNDRIERTISFSPVGGLSTRSFTDLETGASLVPPSKPEKTSALEFSVTCEGASVTGHGHDLRLVEAHEEASDGYRTLRILLADGRVPLQIEVDYRVYDGQPAMRKWLVLKNTGKVPLHLSHLIVEDLYLSIGKATETLLDAGYGSTPRETLYTGRSEDAGLLLSNPRTGNGFAVLNEVPGYMKRTEIDSFYHPGLVHLSAMYDTDLMPFERTLKPGEEFTTAAVSIVAFRHGDGFRDPRWVLPSYTSKILRRRSKAMVAPWIYNTWSPFQRTIDRDTTLQSIDVAGEIGVDIFTIDDGWQKEYGENDIDLKQFPGGLEPIRRAVEGKGMRLGLWIPLAAIGTTTGDYRRHSEWQALDQGGKPKSTSTAGGNKVVMCMASPFREAAAMRVNDAIERFNLAYVKLDLTTIFNAYGEAPGCWASGHDHGNWAESLGMIYEGIGYVTRRIYEKHPDVLIDLTFELWGQKHVIDAGLLAAGDLDWISNVDDSQADSAGPLQARTILYQRATSMPVESMLIGNLQADLPSPVQVFATAIGSAPLILGDLRKLTPADRAWYREHILWYKKVRQSEHLDESFFPLGSWRRPSPVEWDGFARLARTGSGVVVLFGNGSNLSEVKMQLPTMPKGRYRLRSAISNEDIGDFTDVDLERGLNVPIPSPAAVQIVKVTALP